MKTLSLISDTDKPCGVETFARCLAVGLARHDGQDLHKTFRLTGQPGEQALLTRALDRVDALIVNVPVVAWKKVLFGPTLAMRQARARGKEVIFVLHEWADLDWKRRATYVPALRYATRLQFSSPLVRAQFNADALTRGATRRRDLVPIPPNLARPAMLPVTALAMRLDAMRQGGAFVLGHFGAIYPKKQSIAVLDIAAALKASGRRVHAVFIGDFIDGASIDARALFEARVQALGLEREVTITGYIGPAAEVFAAMEACDALVYLLPEGLTSRRGSVLAALQTSAPVVVNGPLQSSEFDHHEAFRQALSAKALTLLANEATPADFAVALRALPPRRAQAAVDYEAAWEAVVSAVRDPALPIASGQ